MRGKLETIVGAMFAGKTSELLKRILWAKHQQKNILVLKPSIDNRFSNKLIVTHNNLSHECYAMRNWNDASKNFNLTDNTYDIVFLDEVQFMQAEDTVDNVEKILNSGTDVICAGLDQDSRGKPWETSAFLLGLINSSSNVVGWLDSNMGILAKRLPEMKNQLDENDLVILSNQN